MTSQMKKRATLTMAVLTAAGITACGGDGHDTASMPGQPTVQKLDTAQVLSLAQKTSETSSPFPVNDGQLELTDTSETTEPISINAQ